METLNCPARGLL